MLNSPSQTEIVDFNLQQNKALHKQALKTEYHSKNRNCSMFNTFTNAFIPLWFGNN